MSSNKYWKGVEELEQTQEFVTSNANEFSEGLPLEKIFSNDDARLSKILRLWARRCNFSGL